MNVASSLSAQQYNNSLVVVCSRRRRRLPFGVKERESVDLQKWRESKRRLTAGLC